MKEHYECVRVGERLNGRSLTKKKVCFLGHMMMDEYSDDVTSIYSDRGEELHVTTGKACRC